MATLTVNVPHDYRGESLTDIDAIVFTGGSFERGLEAKFASNQFGAGLISNTVTITGNDVFDVIYVYLSEPGTFSAAGWVLTNWVGDFIVLNGSAGADTLISSSDPNDALLGGAGDDTYFIESASDYVGELENEGIDTVVVTANTYSLGGKEAENLTFSGVGDFIGFGNLHSNVMIGGDGNDTLVAHTIATLFAHDADSLTGGAGNDTLYGDAFDTLSGGAGFDVLQVINAYDITLDLAAAGIEYVVSEFGNDAYTAETSLTSTEVYGGGGNDTITGGNGDDRLWGGVGNDVLAGGFGLDTLVGDLGADRLSGGAGGDRLYIDTDDTLIDGGSGFDAAYIAGGTGMTLDMAATHLEWVQDTVDGDDTIDASSVGTFAEIYAGGGNDTVTGGAGNEVMFGGAGDDVLVGGDNGDTLVGEAGADRLSGGNGADVIYFDADDTLVDGGDGYDQGFVQSDMGVSINMAAAGLEGLGGAGGNDTIDASGVAVDAGRTVNIFGGDGDDTITGSSGRDNVYGGEGINTIFGGAEDDMLFGGTSNDTIVGGAGADRMDGWIGNDILYIDSDDTLVNGRAGFDIAYIDGGSGTFLDLAGAEFEFVQDFAGGNDLLNAAAALETVQIYGGGGNDLITGGAGADALFGEAGDDIISGDTADDSIVGGAGADTLFGGDGFDRLVGGEGDDLFDGGSESDRFAWTTNGGTDAVAGWEDGIDRLEFSDVAGVEDFGDLTVASNGADAEVFLGADKVFVVTGAAGLIEASDFLFTFSP